MHGGSGRPWPRMPLVQDPWPRPADGHSCRERRPKVLPPPRRHATGEVPLCPEPAITVSGQCGGGSSPSNEASPASILRCPSSTTNHPEDARTRPARGNGSRNLTTDWRGYGLHPAECALPAALFTACATGCGPPTTSTLVILGGPRSCTRDRQT
jgi:hypothetical protein